MYIDTLIQFHIQKRRYINTSVLIQFFGSFSFRLIFFCFSLPFSSSFSLQILSWLSNFSVLFRFSSFFLLHFASFSFLFASEFAVSLRCETSEIMPFFCIQAKQNFRFDFNFCFRSKNEGAP